MMPKPQLAKRQVRHVHTGGLDIPVGQEIINDGGVDPQHAAMQRPSLMTENTYSAPVRSEPSIF
jgi:hypothetical protein